jgi:hypothetical protein
MLSKTILDNLWQSGFCRVLIRLLKNSKPGQAGGAARIEITRAHIASGCHECHYANTIRSVEAETAGRLGPTAVMLFQRGGDIRSVPGFQKVFRQTMNEAVSTGIVDAGVMAWMSKLVPERAGKPYPYAEDDDGSQAN